MSYLYLPLWDKYRPVHYLEYLEEEHKKNVMPPAFCKNFFLKSYEDADNLLYRKCTHITLNQEIEETSSSGCAIVEIDIKSDQNLLLKDIWESIYLIGHVGRTAANGWPKHTIRTNKKIENPKSPKKMRLEQKHAFLFSYYLGNNPEAPGNNIKKSNPDINKVICSYL